jgi:hypothetical protein
MALVGRVGGVEISETRINMTCEVIAGIIRIFSEYQMKSESPQCGIHLHNDVITIPDVL